MANCAWRTRCSLSAGGGDGAGISGIGAGGPRWRYRGELVLPAAGAEAAALQAVGRPTWRLGRRCGAMGGKGARELGKLYASRTTIVLREFVDGAGDSATTATASAAASSR